MTESLFSNIIKLPFSYLDVLTYENSMESNENQIIADCQAGNWEDFGLIYDQYLPKIYQYIFYRTHHKQTAEDLTATVFLKVVQNIGSYKAIKSPFAVWLYRIARNTVIDHARVSKPTFDLEQAYNVASKDDVAGAADRSLKIDLLQKAMKNLTPVQQEVLTLRVWDGLSHREIAEILKISEASSKVTLSRAVASIKQMVPAALFIAIILNS